MKNKLVPRSRVFIVSVVLFLRDFCYLFIIILFLIKKNSKVF